MTSTEKRREALRVEALSEDDITAIEAAKVPEELPSTAEFRRPKKK